MENQKFKRNIAYKFRIGDLMIGKPIIVEDRFQFLELGDKKVIRVNIVGNIVDKYESESEKKYLFLKLDDGSGQIALKVFGDDVEKFRGLVHGETIIVIGRLNNWNNETYIVPEVIKVQSPKYLLLRKLETEKQRAESAPPIKKEQIIALQDKILEKIKASEKDGGIETEKIIMEIRDISPELINQKIQKLVEDGIINSGEI